MTRAWWVAAVWLAAAPVQAADASAPVVPAPAAVVPAPAGSPSVDAGRRAYTVTCARCHGINLVSSSSAFFDLRTFPKEEKARFIESVTNGKRQMPAWGGLVKPDTIESIWMYIGSVNGW